MVLITQLWCTTLKGRESNNCAWMHAYWKWGGYYASTVAMLRLLHSIANEKQWRKWIQLIQKCNQKAWRSQKSHMSELKRLFTKTKSITTYYSNCPLTEFKAKYIHGLDPHWVKTCTAVLAYTLLLFFDLGGVKQLSSCNKRL